MSVFPDVNGLKLSGLTVHGLVTVAYNHTVIVAAAGLEPACLFQLSQTIATITFYIVVFFSVYQFRHAAICRLSGCHDFTYCLTIVLPLLP